MYKKERKFNVIADQNERWTIRNSTAWKAQVLFLDQAWQSNSFFVNMQTQTVYLQFYLVLILNTSTCFVKHMVYKKRKTELSGNETTSISLQVHNLLQRGNPLSFFISFSLISFFTSNTFLCQSYKTNRIPVCVWHAHTS